MACGCEAEERFRETERQKNVARAAMCTACVGRSAKCKRSGEAVTLHIGGRPCPRGWHPKVGIVRWLGVDWIGVPMPVRVYLWWRWDGREDLPGYLRLMPGCGCVLKLKAWWEKVRDLPAHHAPR